MPTRPPEEMDEAFIDAPGCRVRLWRGGDGPTLVTVVDCTDPLELWTEALVELSGHFAVIAIEQPGSGYSDASESFGYRFDDHLDALRFVVDSLDVSGAFGLGHCIAGTQLLALADEEPARFSAVVLAESFPADRYGDLAINMLIHKLARPRGAGELFMRLGGERSARMGSRHILSSLGAGKAWVTDALVDRHITPVLEGHNPLGGVLHNRHWDGELARPIEERVTVPATYIFGAEGRFARFFDVRSSWAAKFGREVRTIPGAGHFLYVEQPEGFAAEVHSVLGGSA